MGANNLQSPRVSNLCFPVSINNAMFALSSIFKPSRRSGCPLISILWYAIEIENKIAIYASDALCPTNRGSKIQS